MKNVFSKNKKYVAEYKRWFDKLPKKQKALMKQLGLDKPHIDDYTTRQKFDISDIQIADETYTPDESDEKKVYSRSELRELLTDYTEKILHEIVSRRNLNLTVESMLWIIGRSPYSTEQQIASALRITRASVSARCVELKDKFGLENSFSGKNISTREKKRSATSQN